MKRTGSLFHTIVVVGAALGAGCGSDEHRPPHADAATADARVADARRPDAVPEFDAPGIDAAVDAMVIIL